VKLRSFPLKLNRKAIVTNIQLHGYGLNIHIYANFVDVVQKNFVFVLPVPIVDKR